MAIKDPSPVHAAKRQKNFAMLGIIVFLIVLLFAVTLVRTAMTQ